MIPRRRLFVLLGIFILLLAAAFLQSRESAQRQPTPPPLTADSTTTPTLPPLLRVFPEMTVLDIQAIRIEDPNSDDAITLFRDSSDNWTSPDFEGQLDTAASDIARTIVLLPYSRSINITSRTMLSDYGFEPNGQLFISLVMKNGEGHVLAVGALSETAPVYYALLDDRDEIFEVERGPVEFLRNFLLSPPLNLTN
jgi:hypothetical protein